MVEQPCPAEADEGLRSLKLPILLCADESCHVAADVERLVGKYDLVNIKLDKAGGITGALELEAAAKEHGMGVMVGCMLATSLAIAPGVLAGQHARYVDLDGPLALSRDRTPGMTYRDGYVFPAPAALWG
jgi:L-alanine-DL-glutamate epimerase-like enolase superfamily enzyme